MLVLHQMVNLRKRINYIGRICTVYGFTENPSEVEEIDKHFELLYSSESFPRPTLGVLSFLLFLPIVLSGWRESSKKRRSS